MDPTKKESTDEKLMLAAIDLIAEKGYHGASTMEIATAAGLSEKTLFRRFGSKQNLLESAFERFHYGGEMKKLFSEHLVWDLYQDLLMISRTYHENMNRNRKLIQISIKIGDLLPGFREKTHEHPRLLKELLSNYFEEMHKRGKLIPTNPRLQATSFMLLNFGAFMNNLDTSDSRFQDVSLDEFIEESVRLFARALTP